MNRRAVEASLIGWDGTEDKSLDALHPVPADARTIESIHAEYRQKWAEVIGRYGDKYAVPAEVVRDLQEWLRQEHLRRHGLDGAFRPLGAKPVQHRSYESKAAAARRRQQEALRHAEAKRGAAA